MAFCKNINLEKYPFDLLMLGLCNKFFRNFYTTPRKKLKMAIATNVLASPKHFDLIFW